MLWHVCEYVHLEMNTEICFSNTDAIFVSNYIFAYKPIYLA